MLFFHLVIGNKLNICSSVTECKAALRTREKKVHHIYYSSFKTLSSVTKIKTKYRERERKIGKENEETN